jgi:hypothetical protein
MNAPTLFESARSYNSDESTVETELSTVEDLKEEEKEPNLLPVAPAVLISTNFFQHQKSQRTFFQNFSGTTVL